MMAIKAKFFNGVEYDATDVNEQFQYFYTNGIVSNTGSIGGSLAVTRKAGLFLAVASGIYCINGGVCEIDGDGAEITLDAADENLSRIDTIAIEYNLSTDVHTIRIVAVKGTPASTPEAPELQNTSTIYQEPLADVLIPAGATEAGTITDRRQLIAYQRLSSAEFIDHENNRSNPHGVTAAQLNAQTAYTSLEQIGLTNDTASSFEAIHRAMPVNSLLVINWVGKSTNSGAFGKLMPAEYGSLVVRRTHISTWRFQPYNPAGAITADLGEYCGNFNNVNGNNNDSKWSGWARGGYPVGSIYMSLNATSPAALFGGTWERIQDRFLLAAGSGYAAGAAGGEDVHELVNSELPYIGWLDALGYENAGSGYGVQISSKNINLVAASSGTPHFGTLRYEINKAGSNNAHNNMPPYLAVYVWKRTA